MVLGLPGETPDDVMRTLELVDDLRPHPSILLPLWFVSFDDAILRGKPSFNVEMCTGEHWQLMAACLDHSLEHLPGMLHAYTERLTCSTIRKSAIRSAVRLAVTIAKPYLRSMRQGKPPVNLERKIQSIRP